MSNHGNINDKLPAYRSHKIVRAARIDRTTTFPPPHEGQMQGALLYLKGPGIEDSVTVSRAWLEKHEPQPGGYYVVYADGYASWSPAEAFEQGYTRVTDASEAPGKLTPEDVEAAIVDEQYHVFPCTTMTVCCLTLYNGFTAVGESACVRVADFNAEIGRRIAREKAMATVWQVLGFRNRELAHAVGA